MSLRSVLSIGMLLAACQSDAGDSMPADSGVEPPATFQPLASLRLEAALAVSSPVEAGQNVLVKAKVVNISSEPVPVVPTGDGSEVGWREPHVFFTAQHEKRSVRELDYSRCGLWEGDWTKEVKLLASGASLELRLGLADQFLDLQTPGKYQLQVHYRYAQGKIEKGGAPVPPALEGVPAFELVSNNIALEVRRPPEVRLEALTSLESGIAKPSEDVFRVVLHNHGPARRAISTPTVGRSDLSFEVDENKAPAPGFVYIDREHSTKTLEPGKSAVVFGKDSVIAPSGEKWTVEKPGKLRVRVDYQGIRSNWVTVVVR